MGTSMSDRFGYILTIEEDYWNRFQRQIKNGKSIHAYVSSASFLRDDVKRIFFYSVRTHKDILGCADFIERKVGDPVELWNKFGHETCFKSHDEYQKVARKSDKVIFIRFKNLHVGMETVPFEEASEILGLERMPQTGMYVNEAQAKQLIELLK